VFAEKNAFLQGTLELLILKAVSWGPVHGYGIARWIEQTTEDVLRVEDGSLYPALYRLTRKGWLQGEWGVTETNRRAKYYTLTPSGRRQLTEQVSGWHRLALAVTHAVNSRHAPAEAR
jgi:PadR family transcriptional regulator, regulatory protein PadR